MEDGFAKLLAGIAAGIGVIARATFAIVATIAGFAGLGVFGMICVKLQRPLVSPHGPLAVPLVYSLLWAPTLTLALAFAGNGLGEFMPRRPPAAEYVKDAIFLAV